MKEVKVKNLMTKEVLSLSTEDIVTKVEEMFRNNNIHHIPITSLDNMVVGIISKSDFERISAGMRVFKITNKDEYNKALYRSLRAGEIMTPNPHCLTGEDNIIKAVNVFKGNNMHALPITKDGVLEGILTPYDLMIYFIENCKCIPWET